MKHSDKIDGVIAALHLAKTSDEWRPAVRNAENPHFKSGYVTLDAVLDAVEDALHAHGLIVVQATQATEAGNQVLDTRIVHVSGQWIGCTYPVHPVKPGPQNEGSALTYARRYALMALLGIAPEDDDGNAAQAAAVDPQEERLETMRAAYEKNRASVEAFQAAVAADNVHAAVEAWYEIPRDDAVAIYAIAPSKGGCLSTRERAYIKSNEFYHARLAFHKEKAA